MEDKKQLKTERIYIKVTHLEKLEIEKLAKFQNKNISKFILNATFKNEVGAFSIDTESKIILSRIGNNLNQIAKLSNQKKQAEDISEVLELIKSILEK